MVGTQLRIVNKAGLELPRGEVGEIVVRGPQLMKGYWKMPEANANTWRNGWFHTGDAFRRDEEGNFYFCDRIKDAIRRRGENISSFEVEDYLHEHSDVLECAAVPVRSDDPNDEEVKVVVVRRPGTKLTAEALITFLIPRMPRFMVPRYVEFAEVLPKTETHKVKKSLLRENPLNKRTWDRDQAGIKVPK
jgi:crotonobetaine/carnitine-CoA ligase